MLEDEAVKVVLADEHQALDLVGLELGVQAQLLDVPETHAQILSCCLPREPQLLYRLYLRYTHLRINLVVETPP